MSTASRYQGGLKKESAYGVDPTVDQFFRVIKDTVKPDIATLESKSLRPGQAPHQSGFVNYTQGASGQISMEVSTKQFGAWFAQCFGALTTSGPSASYYTHTYTMDDIDRSHTWQGNRPRFPTNADKAFTFTGGKVSKFKLATSTDNLLLLDVDVDYQNWTYGTALATASYPSADLLFSFLGATVSLGGTTIGALDWSLEVDNSLNVNRRYLDGTGLKSEQKGTGDYPVAMWAVTLDFDDTTQIARIAQASADAGAVAAVNANFAVAGSSSIITVSIPAARFEEGFPEVSGPASLQTPLKGRCMFDGTNSPVTLTYKTLTAQGF